MDDPGESQTTTRRYQQEMLEESLRRNIIIALDTGSGKTHIAILRMMIELQREPHKILWFLAPTVTLVDQQHSVIRESVPVSTEMISGALQPDQWKDESLWQKVLSTHRIVVSTPQVLLDALRNGYILLGRDIALIVFDEAHHAVGRHPMALIMADHYCLLPARSEASVPKIPSVIHPDVSVDNVRPMILGLTASPIFGTNVITALQTIEKNLDSTVRTATLNRDELAQFVHRPTFKHAIYDMRDHTAFSTNQSSLDSSISSLNIWDDPFVKHLQSTLADLPRGSPEWKRIDQKLSRAIDKCDTYCHRTLQDASRTALKLLNELGAWAADWYVYEIVRLSEGSSLDQFLLLPTLKTREKQFIAQILSTVSPTEVSYLPDDIQGDVTSKVDTLISTLLEEQALARTANEPFSCIVFVTERVSVIALAHALKHHPLTKGVFKIGSLVGISEDSRRNTHLDVTRAAFRDTKQQNILANFKIGLLDLLICTSVAEEGIDIQACGCVIRWDPPPNTASWAQSRGRARRQKSTFILMLEHESSAKTISDWHRLEQEMVAAYNDPSREEHSQDPENFEDDNWKLEEPSTGAVVDLMSVIPRLNHFCAVIPSRDHANNLPYFDLDPLDYVDGWHSLPSVYRNIVPYAGPWGATVTLPRSIPLEKRVFGVDRRYSTKRSAFRHVALEAYRYLQGAGLLNEHLLPLSTTFDVVEDSTIRGLLEDIEKRQSTMGVGIQMNPWLPPTEENEDMWCISLLEIGDLPPLHLFTVRKAPSWNANSAPVLHPPRSSPVAVNLTPMPGTIPGGDVRVQKAREYTRKVFWATCMHRMKDWEATDFCYLILPVDFEDRKKNDSLDTQWMDSDAQESGRFLAPAHSIGQRFGYPSNLTLVKAGYEHSKPLRFLRWEYGPLEEEEEIKFRRQNARSTAGRNLNYPVLAVEELPPKVNYLVPHPSETKIATREPKVRYLDPSTASVVLASNTEIEYSLFLPSVLRALAMSLTVSSLSSALWSDTPLLSLNPNLLRTAILAPSASEAENYQRLETLGDTVLKFSTSFQLLGRFPLWHEGYLSKKRDHSVANATLAKRNIELGLFRWIIRDRMIGRKFTPLTFSAFRQVVVTDGEPSGDDTTRPKEQQLSSKVLADVVEAIIGACYLHGGLGFAVECCTFLGLGIEWERHSTRVDELLSRVVDAPVDLPPQLNTVEEMIGYVFKRKALLLEALTHTTSLAFAHLPSYERLEFAGDAILDLVVTEYVFGFNYSPGHMLLRKAAMVNASILAYFCFRTRTSVVASLPRPSDTGKGSKVLLQEETQEIGLYQCIVHQSQTILDDVVQTKARYQLAASSIEESLQHGTSYPWAELSGLQAPKFFSDVLESIVGAVYLDSGGSLDVVRSVLRSIGWLPVLERIVTENVSVLHPVALVQMWAQRHGKKPKFEMLKHDGKVGCAVFMDEEEVVRTWHDGRLARGRAGEAEVKLIAAQQATKVLHMRL